MRTCRLVVLMTEAEKALLAGRAEQSGESLSVFVRQTLLKGSVSTASPVEKPPTKTIHCKQCDNDWTPKVANPKQCPECKSYDWNRTRQETYADFEARHNAEAESIGITPEEYQKQEQALARNMDLDELKAHARRWKAMKEMHGATTETWAAAKWATAAHPDTVAKVDAAEDIFLAIRKITLDK